MSGQAEQLQQLMSFFKIGGAATMAPKEAAVATTKPKKARAASSAFEPAGHPEFVRF